MPVFQVEFDISKLKSGAKDAITVIGDTTRQLEKASVETDTFAKKMKSASGILKGFIASYAILKINEIRKSLVDAGSDAQETANKFSVVFSTIPQQADSAVEKLRNFYGMSRTGAQAALSDVADLLAGLGITQQKALELAEQTVQLGTDLASFTNFSGGATGATQALTSALLGETEAAKSLGVVLTDDQMDRYASSVGKAWKDLDLAEKAQLRLNAAIAQSPNAIGDFERSMNSYANQVRVAESLSKDFTSTVGEGMIQAHSAALISINGNRDAIDQLATVISGFLATEGDNLVSFLEDVSEKGNTSSTEVSLLAISFVQAAGGTKALWNGLQLAVDGIIALVDAVIVGKEQLNLFGEALYKVMTFDFSGASQSLDKAGELGRNWSKRIRESFSTDWNDMMRGLDMVSNPEKMFKEYADRVAKLRKDAAESARESARQGAPLPKGNADDKKGKKEAEKFAESSAQYEAGLKKLRNEVSSLESALDPTLTKFERMRVQIEAERDAAIQNADVVKEETIRRKQATAAQAEQVAELTKRKAVLEANKKLEELENQNLQEKAEFYKQLSEKTGEYSSSISYQNQLLEKQRQVWVAMGIPIEDVNKMLEILSLELSRDPWAGAYRSLTRYRIETENLAASFENLTTGTLTGIEDAFVKMAETGKLSFRDLANSIISDLMRIAVRMSITGPLAGALGSGLSSLFNFGGGTTTTSVMGNSISSGWASSFMGGLNLFASGGVASPSWGLPSSGGLLTRPTYFHDGMNRAYARGGLSVAGEAGPEVFMPAVPMSDGKYGVRVQGMGSSSPVVNVTVINNAGAQVETNQRQNEDGSLDLEIMVTQAVARDMSRRNGATNNVLRKGYGLGMIPTSR